MRLRRKRKSSQEAIDNPKFFKLLKLKEHKVEEILGIFMKVKGKCHLYESMMQVPIYKIYNLRRIFKDNDNPDFEDVAEAIHVLTFQTHPIKILNNPYFKKLRVKANYKKIVSKRTLEICKLYKFVVDGLNLCAEKEGFLSRKIEADEYKAGINRLNAFGELTSLKVVADFYNETLEQAEKRKYEQCFAVWLYQKEKAVFDKQYFDIKNKPK